MNKNQLRKLYLEKRKSLSPGDCEAKSQSIADLFFSSPEFELSKVRYIHIYLPIRGKNEMDTFLIFNEVIKNYPNLTIALSKSNFNDFSMQFYEYVPATRLIENAFGIPEPDGGKLINPEELDLVIVPLLVVDEKGNRVGYGKGFYDRFLAKCKPTCKKIGLSFEKPVFSVNSDIYDVPLDFCITTERIFTFR